MPCGHHDVTIIRNQLGQSGFAIIELFTATLPTDCPSPRDAAARQCHGSPLRSEIESRDPTGLDAATDAAAAALAARFGDGPVESTMQTIVFTAVG